MQFPNKVLVIAYYLPPAGVVGVYRTLKFMKYLPDFGWQPVALTVSNGKFPTYDASLVDLIPEGVPVHRCRAFELFNMGLNKPADDPPKRTLWRRIRGRMFQVWNSLCLPDANVTWVPNATIHALRLIRRENIRHVYISGKPFSSFLIGCLVKRFSGAKLLVDYRDPWTQNITYYHRSPLHSWWDKKLETYVVRTADIVIANTRHNNARMIEEFGEGQKEDKFRTIHNGFDRADFDGAETDGDGRFTITYAGGFYFSIGSDYSRQAGDTIMRTYSPLYFFDALEKLFQRRPDIKMGMRVNFMGHLGHGYDPIIAEKGLDGVVNRLGYIDYDEHIAVLKNSSALLLVLSRGEKSRGWIPSKFFQYLGSGNPILGLVPEGEVRTIIEEARAGVCVEPDDVDAIAGAVERMFDLHAAGELKSQRDEAEVAKYERRHLTGLLAAALDAA
jgi:glycosyltransferase involved in cell wall biosynthesis